MAPEADATRDLYERYGKQIFGFCLYQLGSREEAEDAAQSTFLNAFRGLSRGITPDAESAWLFKIAHNVCLTRRRSSWRRRRVESPGDLHVLQDVVPAPQQRGSDELIDLEEALAAMPRSQQTAILLREWQGLSYREIAAHMEISQPAVETLIFRARRSLAKGLEQPTKAKRGIGRLGHALDAGWLVTGLKALFTGGAAAKAIVTAAAVTTVGVVASVPRDQAPKPPAMLPSSSAAIAPAAERAPAVRQAVTPDASSARAGVAVMPPTSSVAKSRSRDVPITPVTTPPRKQAVDGEDDASPADARPREGRKAEPPRGRGKGRGQSATAERDGSAAAVGAPGSANPAGRERGRSTSEHGQSGSDQGERGGKKSRSEASIPSPPAVAPEPAPAQTAAAPAVSE
ncbi:MAG: sigma-70 family RNA polymerase sigma factor, partial [Gaiellaceae bacterium]